MPHRRFIDNTKTVQAIKQIYNIEKRGFNIK